MGDPTGLKESFERHGTPSNFRSNQSSYQIQAILVLQQLKKVRSCQERQVKLWYISAVGTGEDG
jgi:hypothetical protein